MAITTLKRVTLVGQESQKSHVLQQLQNSGILHLIDLTPVSSPQAAADPFKDTRLALKYLEDCPQKQRPARHLGNFNAMQQVERILKIKADIEALQDERDHLNSQIQSLQTWGEFHLPPPEQLGGMQLFFYQINGQQKLVLAKTDYVYKEIKRDNRYFYIVVLHPTAPRDLPFLPIQLPHRPLHQLQNRLEDVEDDIENLETRRIGATRFIQGLSEYLINALNASELEEATHKTYEESGLFVMQGWCPLPRLVEVQEIATKQGLALKVQEPSPEDRPPTLLTNRTAFSPGETLIQVYGTPGYRSWDPSPLVYVSFVFFFGMITADAGYGFLLGVLTFIFRQQLRSQPRLHLLARWLSISAIVYGILAGEYFGLEPPEGSFLAQLAIFQPDLTNIGQLMAFSIGIGIVHVSIANGISVVRKWGTYSAVVHFGWILAIIGGYTTWLFQFMLSNPALGHLGLGLLGAGMGIVFGVTLFKHPSGFLHEIENITKMFGDVLSYLRLFALGLSSTYLAVTFNLLAKDVAGFGELGLLFAFLILVLGHGLNFILCIMAGTIHGLRLNFIELYRWSQDPEDEGYPFKPFRKHVRDSP